MRYGKRKQYIEFSIPVFFVSVKWKIETGKAAEVCRQNRCNPYGIARGSVGAKGLLRLRRSRRVSLGGLNDRRFASENGKHHNYRQLSMRRFLCRADNSTEFSSAKVEDSNPVGWLRQPSIVCCRKLTDAHASGFAPNLYSS